MSFLNKFFGRQKLGKIEYVKAMVEMAAESERTYRGMIDAYNSDVELGLLSRSSGTSAVPTGRGIYKARLFGALFMVVAYTKSVAQSQAESEEMLNMATGVALEPLQGPGGPRLDREEAKSFTLAYLTSTFEAMVAAFDAGPLLPSSAQRQHLVLADHLHDALTESIGAQHYTAEVRERFTVMVQGNTAMAMNHARRWLTR